MKNFEKFIEESFTGEKLCRELRLSEAEIEYLKKLYPNVMIREIYRENCKEAKIWVEVKLSNAV